MSNQLDTERLEINRWIDRLDEVARSVESRWGIDRLHKLVSPETQVKWERHVSKLNDAILSHDLTAVADLVQGAIRGYAALEKEAVNLGAAKNHPDVWDVRSDDGTHYRICKTRTDANFWANQPNVIVYALEEVARILDASQLKNQASFKEVKKHTNKTDPFDFTKGDEINF